jgi:peroxiredoxin
MQNKYRNLGFEVIGISMDDSPKPVRNFYERFRLNYPVAMGDAKVAQLYGGVYGLPVTFVIGRDGSIAAKFKGAADLVVLQNKIESELKAAQ